MNASVSTPESMYRDVIGALQNAFIGPTSQAYCKRRSQAQRPGLQGGLVAPVEELDS